MNVKIMKIQIFDKVKGWPQGSWRSDKATLMLNLSSTFIYEPIMMKYEC